jgi:hypothetical protein
VLSLIYFTRELPGLSEDLSEHGFQIYEALAISEVLYLCQQHPWLVVVIGPHGPSRAASEIAEQRVTLRPKKKATVRDVVWKLSGHAATGYLFAFSQCGDKIGDEISRRAPLKCRNRVAPNCQITRRVFGGINLMVVLSGCPTIRIPAPSTRLRGR